MHIVLVSDTYYPYISGVSSSTHSIARFLADQGHKVTIIAPQQARRDPTVDHEPGIRVVRTWSIWDPWYKGRKITPIPFLIPEVYPILTRDVDIVHVQEPTFLGLTVRNIARRRGIPVVGALHFTPEQIARMVLWIPLNWSISLTQSYIRWVYNRYDEIMVPTQTFVDFLHSIGVKKPTIVISNGVDVIKFQPVHETKTFRKKLHLPEDKVLFFVLGRFDRDKYVDDVVKALPDTAENIELVIAGVGPEQKTLHSLADTLGVSNRIHWVGQIRDDEMVDYYHASDGYVIMSLHEVQSITTLQAVASGLPVVAVRAGALPELAVDGVNGFLVSPHDSKTLGSRLSQLAADPVLRARMGRESRLLSLKHDKTKAMARVESWHKSVVAKHRT
jgi:1,2-diacylglycerol 3-alpha-glucosyltransferase